jgi:putative membrane protein
MLNLIPILLGILTGTITGLTPGLHINIITTLTLSLSIIYNLPPTILVIFITTLAITHTFLDFIPSIYLGAPDADTALGTLPGHELLLKGQAHQAIKLTIIGSTIAILSLIIIIPTFTYILPKIHNIIQQMMGFILIWTSIFLISKEKQNKILATLIFALAGILGITTLNSNIQNPLLPLLTGLFGTSTLIQSINTKTTPPKQQIKKLNLSKKEILKPTTATILISPICSLLPGLGSAQAAIIGSEITGKLNRNQFLILLGSVNTLVMSVSFLTLYLFSKTRTGAAYAISQITTITPQILTTIFTTILIASLIAIPITIITSKFIAKNIHKISYTKISKTILLFLIILNFYLTGISGILTLTTSTLLGLLCINLQIRRSFLMGAILIPTIIYYLPL